MLLFDRLPIERTQIKFALRIGRKKAPLWRHLLTFAYADGKTDQREKMPKATAPQMLDRDWLTVAQTAAYFQCSTRTVRRYIESGLLSKSQPVVGGKIRISAIAIETLLESNRH
jgi:excisionase family DNA binding protein